MKCDHCPKTIDTKTDRLPPGWKRHQDKIWCRDCWSRSYVLRAVTIPVAGPMDGEWPELRETLKQCWASATTVANWAVTELARHDIPRVASQEKLAKMTPMYLYPGARLAAPECNPQSVVAILHAVEGKYRKARYATLWTRSQSHPVYRYPVPYPVHNQGWSCVRGEGDRPCITVRLGERRWLLVLRGGHEFRRQLQAWKQIALGQAVQGELALIGQTVTMSDHRNGVEAREPGGGPRKSLRVMAKMVAWFPRKEAGPVQGTLFVHTSSPAFLVYHVGPDGEPKHLHAEHVKRWEAQHRRRLRSMSDDMKYEKRWPANVRANMLSAQNRWVKKYRDRLSTFTHEASAMLANFAVRQKIATVMLDTADRSFCERFPWHEFVLKLQYKLETAGIALEIVSKEIAREGNGD